MTSQSERVNPFKGLRPFQPEDEEKLFGRDRDLFLMKDRILSSRTTLLFAGSGVGKTSFLNAKIIPALQERYHVIWHNRWTGADESNGDENWDDRTPFKPWPPRAFWRWLVETLRNFSSRRKKTPESQVPSKTTASESDDKVAAEVHRAIAQSLRGSGDRTSLANALSVFKKKPDGESANQQHCVLILDQFEEVFQYHAFEEYFETFIAGVCEIINNTDYNVRIVFSMREEFLGELSVFDNRIKDLFNNYYRLRYPEIAEARDIISQTCKFAETAVDQTNLASLVIDLSKIPKAFADHKHAVDQGVAETRFLRRNFVPPPYLQIVCDRLWKEQYETPPPATAATNGDAGNTTAGAFLEHYRTGSDSANGNESDAQRVVRSFCEEKLSPPFLNEREQDLVARAFGFLVTKQGAKMAYELNNLAYHMEERVWPLKNTLEKLSSPEVRILRESRGPERSYWYELYHDMYAGAIERWKRTYEKAKRHRTRRRLATSTSIAAALILVFGGILYFYLAKPGENERILVAFREQLNTAEIQEAPGYSEAVRAYTTLSNTLFYSGAAHSLWSQVWQRRAQLYEANEKRDEALTCLLQAAALVKGEDAEKIYLTQANNLFTGDDEAIKGTYCTECPTARMSHNGYVLTITGRHGLDIWAPLRSRVCDDCNDALFSADSSLVVGVSPIIEEAPKNERKRNESTQRRPNERSTGDQQAALRGDNRAAAASTAVADEPSRSEPPRETAAARANRERATPSPSPQTDTQPLPTPSPTPILRTVGWRVKLFQVPPSETYSSRSFDIRAPQPVENQNADESTPVSLFRLKAVSRLLLGNLVAGMLNNELIVWRDNGQVLPVKSGETKFKLLGDAIRMTAAFSRDGRFFAAGGVARNPNQLWEVTPEGLVLSTKITKLAPGSGFVFSPNGRYFLAVTEDRRIRLWDLSDQSEVLNIDLAGKFLSRIGFGRNSGKFFVAQRDGLVTVWDSDSRQTVFQPLKVGGGPGSAMLLDSEGKTIVRRVGTAAAAVYEKWSLETGQKMSEVKVRGGVKGNYLDNDGSLLISAGSEVRRWEFLSPKPHEVFKTSPEEASTFADLSRDGETLFTFEDKGWEQQASIFRLWNVSTRTLISSGSSEQSGYYMSPDALRIAVILESGRTLKILDRTRSDTKELTFPDDIVKVAFDPAGKIMAVATANPDTVYRFVHLVDTSSYTIVKTLKSEVEISSLTFDSNGRFLSVQAEGGLPAEFADPLKPAPILEVWSVATGQKAPLKLNLKDAPDAVDVSRDDHILIAQNNRILIHRLDDGQVVREFSYDKNLALAKFTPDAKFVLTSDDKGELQLWDVASGQPGTPLSMGHKATEIVFNSDGASFVAATTSWMHRIAIVGNALKYSDGILCGLFEPSTLRVKQESDPKTKAPVAYVRWISRSLQGLQAEQASFDGKMSRQVLQGEPDKLLEQWVTRLGINITPLGYLSKN